MNEVPFRSPRGNAQAKTPPLITGYDFGLHLYTYNQRHSLQQYAEISKQKHAGGFKKHP